VLAADAGGGLVRTSTPEPLRKQHLLLSTGRPSTTRSRGEETGHIAVHSPGLLTRAAEDSDLAVRLEEQSRRVATAGQFVFPPHGWPRQRCRSLRDVPSGAHRASTVKRSKDSPSAVVAGTDSPVGDVQAQEDLQ